MVEGKQEVLFKMPEIVSAHPKIAHEILAQTICEECLEVVEVHPVSYIDGDEAGKPYLRELCGGTLVKVVSQFTKQG